MTRLDRIRANGPPKPKLHWPDQPSSDPVVWATQLSCALWARHFVAQYDAPSVYWSERIGRTTLVHAKCFDWGIVVSRPQYLRVRQSRRDGWFARVLLHELLHWAGYHRHDATFRALAKQLGTW